MARLVAGGLIAGLVVFIWSAISHILLPIGEMGLRSLPNENVLIPALKAAVIEPGLYFYPGMPAENPTPEQEQAWEARFRSGPWGLLLYHPQGTEPMSTRQLATGYANDALAALLAGYLLTMVTAPFWGRVMFSMLLGVFAWITLSIPYWNWYGFPTAFVAAEAIDQTVGWFLGGLVLAAIVKPRSAQL